MYETLLILHILSAFLFGGGIFSAIVVGVTTSGWTSTRSILSAAQVQDRLGNWVVAPGGVLALVFGSALVTEAGFEFSAGWIIAAYVLWLIAMAIGGMVMGRHARDIKQRAQALIDDGVEESAELQQEHSQPRVAIFGVLLGVFVIVFEYLMVAKPGA